MVHQYRNNGYHIVLDVNSGSVHVVDEIVYGLVGIVEKLLEEGCSAECGALERRIFGDGENAGADEKDGTLVFRKYPREEVREALEEILELKEAGMLYAPDIYETYTGDFKKRETVVKALCLHIAHDCNLACKYCFAEEGEYHGRRALMSFEVGKKALDFLILEIGRMKRNN